MSKQPSAGYHGGESNPSSSFGLMKAPKLQYDDIFTALLAEPRQSGGIWVRKLLGSSLCSHEDLHDWGHTSGPCNGSLSNDVSAPQPPSMEQ